MRQAQQLKTQGNSYFQKNQFHKAEECYSNAIGLDPSDPIFYNNRAAARMKLNKWVLALEDVNKALELDARQYKAIYRKAQILDNLGKFLEALYLLEHSIEDESTPMPIRKEYDNLLGEIGEKHIQAASSLINQQELESLIPESMSHRSEEMLKDLQELFDSNFHETFQLLQVYFDVKKAVDHALMYDKIPLEVRNECFKDMKLRSKSMLKNHQSIYPVRKQLLQYFSTNFVAYKSPVKLVGILDAVHFFWLKEVNESVKPHNWLANFAYIRFLSEKDTEESGQPISNIANFQQECVQIHTEGFFCCLVLLGGYVRSLAAPFDSS